MEQPKPYYIHMSFWIVYLIKLFETNYFNYNKNSEPASGGVPEVSGSFLAAPSLTDHTVQMSEKVKKERNI